MLDKLDVHTAQREALRADAIRGLSAGRKALPSRWLYDSRGSELFEDITRLDAYYPTRTETAILTQASAEIARFIGESCVLLEYGAGAGLKTEILIDALESPRLYVPIDIAGDFLDQTAARMRARFPQIETWPLIADFTSDFEIPRALPYGRRTAFFPGSTIGNLDPCETGAFLRQMLGHVGPNGAAIVGIDLRKDLRVLLAAYDDDQGVTAAFNLNILSRLNRELGADFDLEGYIHQARWNEADSAVEMHLVSTRSQEVHISGATFAFSPGETIHTESSRKYDLAEFEGLVALHGWRAERVWTDPGLNFAVCGLVSTKS